MTTHDALSRQPSPTRGYSPARAMGLLQRACACGRAVGPTGECMECRRKRGLVAQPKLRVSHTGDRYEQEADRVAEQVIHGDALSTSPAALPVTALQVQPEDVSEIAPEVAGEIESLRGAGQPLNPAARQVMESHFGHDFSQVRIHTGERASETARAIDSTAYTVGRDIVFDSGRYAPATTAGRRLLAHELTHVVQQTAGPSGLLQRAPNPSPARTLRQRGPNPATCMTPLCQALQSPSRSCLRNPQSCAQTFITDVMTCLTAGAAASNATNHQAILNNTRQELQDEIANIDRNQPTRTAQDRQDYVDWLHSVCERKQREVQIEFHYNVVFESVPGGPPWAWYAYNWDEIEAALAAIPDEHLWDRPSGPATVTFRRERQHPTDPNAGGETDPGTGLIRIFNRGMGSTPYTRSQATGIPATHQTIRHEVGHLVEGLVPQRDMDDFFDNIVGWKQYSWAWVTVHPAPYPTWAAQREELCRDVGYQTAAGGCDHARLTQFLNNVGGGTPVAVGNRTFYKDPHGSFLVSWPTGNVPDETAFEYARKAKGEYFAEIYAFAVSNPDYLHRVLPSAQIAWLKAHVFNTQHHYDQIIRPIETQLAIGGNVNAGAFDALLIRAHQQFTRQQLEAFAQLLARLLQRMSLERAGQRVA